MSSRDNGAIVSTDGGSDRTAAAFMMPTDPEQLVVWLERKRKAGHKRMPDLQMKTNLAYTLGHQWIVWDRDRRQFRRPQWRPNDPNAPIRVTFNKIGSIVERTIARLLKQAPEPECRPASDDEDDVGAAQVANRILDHELDRLKWDTEALLLYFWVTVLGWSYMEVSWNPEGGTVLGKLGHDEMEAEGIDGNFNGNSFDPEGQEMTVYTGNIELDVVPAFELSVDANALAFPAAKWAVRTSSMTREAVWEKWNVVPNTDMPGRTLVDEVYALTDKAREDRPYVDTVAVHQMWLRPGSRAYPKGRVVTWCGTTILEDIKEYPYDHGKLPFIQFDLLPGMGAREGRTWVSDLISMQADYNDSRSREAAIRRQLTPKILYPVGSIDAQRVTSRVEMIPYVPTGQPPTILQADSRWMAQFETNMNRAEQEMNDRAGQSDASSGDAPASMPTASVLALQEADDTKLAVSTKLMARGIGEMGVQILELVRQFWTEPRVVRAWSQEGDLEVDDFLGADVGNQLDVHVESESSLPKSKSGRMNLLMELLQAGLIPDPRMFFKQLDMPGLSTTLAFLSIDQKQAERENSKLAEGTQVPINDFDDHAIHLKEHNDFRKGEDYEKLSQQGRSVVDAHCMAHLEQLATLAQTGIPGTPQGVNAPGPQAEGPGGPPPGGPPSPNSGPGYLRQPDGQLIDASTPGGESALANTKSGRMAGIGGPAQPGHVPGVSTDSQAHRMGS